MRVLTVGNLYPPQAPGGGYELTWQSSVAHLRARGHDVRVLASDHREPGAQGEDEPDVHRDLRWYWHEHSFPRLPWWEALALERQNARVLDRHLEEFAPDVVAWWGMGGMSLSLIERVRRAGLPAVGVVGDEWMVWGPKVDSWSRRRWTRSRPDLSAAATWLFNSDAVRRASFAAAGPLERARVAHPGIDDSLFAPAEPREWSWRLLYLGRMDPRKGVGIALRALALLRGDATLTLQGSGDPEYIQELEELRGELGLADRVHFSNRPRADVPQVYADADVVLFPVQWEEPWGLVPLEAMAVGRPVVASGTGGSREYLRDGENCLLYEPKQSPEALADAVRRLAADEPLRQRLREAGFATAAPFTERAYNDAIAAALEEAAGL
jgi:glycogen synthase